MKETRQQYFKLSKDMTRNFSKRKYSQQGLHEKIFIMIISQRNENQKYNKIPHHTSLDGYYKNTRNAQFPKG